MLHFFFLFDHFVDSNGMVFLSAFTTDLRHKIEKYGTKQKK
jgi:hypothetical protein